MTEKKIDDILKNVLTHAEVSCYYGYNKHDALLSPWLYRLFGWSKITRLIATQAVMRFPFNIRSLLGVPKSRNPKGLGLFAQAYLNYYTVTHDTSYLDKSVALLDTLLTLSSSAYGGVSWGYQYPWQDAGFYARAGLSNRVVTCWIGFSFAAAYQITGFARYHDAVVGCVKFLLHAPNRIIDTEKELCLSYVPDPTVTCAVMDVSALTAKMLLLAKQCEPTLTVDHDAARCMQYVINRQTNYGAWFYTDPPGDSHITHDNYHTGIILDTIFNYISLTGDTTYESAYLKGLRYYANNLFTDAGAPKWMNDKTYPYDIHGAAQGIITFSKAAEKYPEYLPLATKCLHWTIDNMLNKNECGFYYQIGKFISKKYTLLRWCNAWMSYAMSSYLRRISQ